MEAASVVAPRAGPRCAGRQRRDLAQRCRAAQACGDVFHPCKRPAQHANSSGAPALASTAFLVADDPKDVPITALARDAYDDWLRAQPAPRRTWVGARGFRAQPGGFCLLPGADGSMEGGLLAIAPAERRWSL